MTVTAQSVPALRRGVRRRYDEVRNEYVLLGPERVVVLDDVANAIAQLCDSTHSIAEISELLSGRYQTPRETVQEDVISFIAEMMHKGLLTA